PSAKLSGGSERAFFKNDTASATARASAMCAPCAAMVCAYCCGLLRARLISSRTANAVSPARASGSVSANAKTRERTNYMPLPKHEKCHRFYNHSFSPHFEYCAFGKRRKRKHKIRRVFRQWLVLRETHFHAFAGKRHVGKWI